MLNKAVFFDTQTEVKQKKQKIPLKYIYGGIR